MIDKSVHDGLDPLHVRGNSIASLSRGHAILCFDGVVFWYVQSLYQAPAFYTSEHRDHRIVGGDNAT